MTESQQLLADYVASGSERAFRELVTRYMDLVYGTALRLVNGDTHRAEDVAQTVFVDLARQGRRLSAETMLGGWLPRHTCFVASKVMRGERRRQLREKQAVEMNALNNAATDLAQIAPVLDEAINELPEEDRRAILLRFYERRDLHSVGEALGSSENAAQKRISRALERLQFVLTHRGVALSATALAAALASGAVTAAPAGFATTAAITALASATAGTGTTLTLFKLMTITKLKVGLAAILVAAVGSQVALRHQSQVRLQIKDQMLQQQNDRIAELTAEAQRLSNLVAGATELRPEKEQNELARLRAEVGALKRDLGEARQTQTNSARIPGPMVFDPGAFREALLTNSPSSNYAKSPMPTINGWAGHF